ncbi:Myb-like transcription factor-like [Oryza sativa Japonica Group]|uniref:Myb-like transcription factor-like n=2 Tax=Oryza sativa subsp. japonica TaxID=39947 RepID=Q5QNG3_ORYSJ|nr:Myb-like transcription factor-like [Oryza sativa Japonica Group]BAD73047.1 Myb-like transcription factor-like [Oryza sativa Japonica Group]
MEKEVPKNLLRISVASSTQDTERYHTIFYHVSRDTRKVSYDFNHVSRDTHEVSCDTCRVSDDFYHVSRDTRKVSDDFYHVSRDTCEVSDDTYQVAATPSSAMRIILRIRLSPAWTPEEDACLERLARGYGFRHWRRVAEEMQPRERRRSPKQCRDRWRDHLARDVYHRPFTADDDAELAHLRLRGGGGDRWKDISRAAHCRTSRAMRRRWRELRKSDAFLRALYWHPDQPVPPLLDDALSCSDVLDSSVASYRGGCDAVAGGGTIVAPGFACFAA